MLTQRTHVPNSQKIKFEKSRKILYCTALHCTALYCTVLNYTVLYDAFCSLKALDENRTGCAMFVIPKMIGPGKEGATSTHTTTRPDMHRNKYAYTHRHTHRNPYTPAFTNTCPHTCTHTYTHTYTHTNTYTWTYTRTYTC